MTMTASKKRGPEAVRQAGQADVHEVDPLDLEGRPDLRRHRHRRRPQRPRQRRVPGQVRPQDADHRAAPPRRRRGHHRGAAPGLLVHDVLVRAEPAAAGHHPRPRADQARLHAAADVDDLRARRRGRLPAVHPGPRPEPARRSRATRSTTPTRTTSTATTSRWSARPSSRCWTWSRRTSSATTPRSSSRSRRLGSRFRKLDKRVLHNAVRLLTGSAADFLDDYFESDLLKGYLASSSIIGTKVGPRSQGSGPRAALPLDRRARRRVRGVGLPQEGQRRLHPGAQRAAASRSAPRSSSSRRSTRSSRRTARATGVALADGTEYYADTVVSALDPRRTFLELVKPRELPDDLVENIQRFRFQGTSSKVNFALDGLPKYPAPRRPRRPVPRLHEHRAVDGLPRARLRRREVRLVQPEPVHRHGRPVDDRRRHGAPRQARHVVLHPVHALPPARERLGHREGEPGRHRPARRSSGSSRASATSCIQREVRDAARHRADRRPERGQHLRRRVLRPADVLLPAGAGLVAVPHADRRLLPVRLGHAPGRLRHGRAGQARRRPDPQGPGQGRRPAPRRPGRDQPPCRVPGSSGSSS